MEGLLHRCECFLINHKMPFLEKVWLADRYKLNRLLALLLRELRPNHKLDLSGARYHGLSDRVKVLLLERMHGSPPPEVGFAIFYVPSFLQLKENCSRNIFVSMNSKFEGPGKMQMSKFAEYAHAYQENDSL